jgi:hypothetical protein
MKAIPTNYNGVTYKSRLEAKWARFFTLIGIFDFEYENVKIEHNGKEYIPDFYLYGFYYVGLVAVEVKPCLPSAQYCDYLMDVTQELEADLILVIGEPNAFQKGFFIPGKNTLKKTGLAERKMFEGFRFTECNNCGYFKIVDWGCYTYCDCVCHQNRDLLRPKPIGLIYDCAENAARTRFDLHNENI